MNAERIAKAFTRLPEDEWRGPAKLIGVTPENEPVDLGQGEDIYDLLHPLRNTALINGAVMKDIQFIVAVTFGWAAPLNENGEADGAPSKHPERKRCLLVMAMSKDDLRSGVRLAGGETEITAVGEGQLRDAMEKLRPFLS